jgi:hypothetical protein
MFLETPATSADVPSRLVTVHFHRPSKAVRVVVRGFGGPLPRWFGPVVERTAELLALDPNWDSYGAAPVQPRAVESALDLLLKVMKDDTPRPAVVPANTGGVQLEWHSAILDLEVEIAVDGTTTVFYQDYERDSEGEGPLELGSLQQILSKLRS